TRLANVLEARLDITDDPIDQASILSRLVELNEHGLGDKRRALDAALRWPAIDPGSNQAPSETDRLAELLGQSPQRPQRLAATASRHELIETLGQAARLATSTDDEKALRVEIAQLESDGPRAIGAWQQVLDLDPDDLAALGALQDAYARAGDWMAIADIQTRR